MRRRRRMIPILFFFTGSSLNIVFKSHPLVVDRLDMSSLVIGPDKRKTHDGRNIDAFETPPKGLRRASGGAATTNQFESPDLKVATPASGAGTPNNGPHDPFATPGDERSRLKAPPNNPGLYFCLWCA